MLRVLIILLCVLGGVVLLLALALLALLNIRARLEFVGVSGDMTLDAVYGPVRVPLWPRPRHLKRKKNRKEDETEQKGEEEPAGGRFSLAKGGLPFGEIADIVLDFLGDLTGSLQITRLRVRLVHRDGRRGEDRHPARTDRRALRHSRTVSGKHIRSARHSCARGPGFRKRQNGMGGGGVLRHPPDHLHQDRIPAQKAAPAAV